MGADRVAGATGPFTAIALSRDQGLQREVAQLRARTTPISLLGIAPDYRWRYQIPRLTRNALAMHSQLRDAALTGSSNGDITDAALIAARLWEALARTDETTKVTALLNAALEYELAGYQANALCLARDVTRAIRTFSRPSPMPDRPIREGQRG
jgi:hypothetical protein